VLKVLLNKNYKNKANTFVIIMLTAYFITLEVWLTNIVCTKIIFFNTT